MYNIPIILRYIHCIDYVTMWSYIIRIMIYTLHYHDTRRRLQNIFAYRGMVLMKVVVMVVVLVKVVMVDMSIRVDIDVGQL